MAATTKRRASTGNQQQGQSLAPLIGPAVIAAAALALYYAQPGLVLVWLGVLLTALLHPPAELTGKKDSYGRHTPADLSEERRLADHEAMRSLRWRLVVPGRHWLPGWPPLGYWLFSVALTVLAYLVPVEPLDVLAQAEEEGARALGEVLVTFGHVMNAAATFLTTTAVFATLRQRAGDDCPGTRTDALVTIAREHPVRTAALTAGAPAAGAGLVLAAGMVAPEVGPLLDLVPTVAWVVLGLVLALGVHAPFLREESLKDWRELVAARRQWDSRWPSVKMHDPMATLVERHTVGANTVDVFDAPPSVGASGYLTLAPKLAPVLGAGRTVVVLNDPQAGPDGAPVPGTVDPVRFRVVDIDDNAPVDLTDPATDLEVARTVVEAGMAQATDMLGVSRASLVSLEPVHADDSTRAAWRAVFAGLSWASLRPQVAMMPGFFGGSEVLVDHRDGQMFVGALLADPATFTDPELPTHLENLAVQDRWNVVWGAASLARHKVSQPAVSPAQCATARLADGTTVERTVFITRVGIPPQDYFGTEDKVAASLNGAPFVAITGYPGTGNRPGERHPQAMCVYSSTRPVPATLDALAPVEGSTVAQVDESAPSPTRPGRAERRRPARRPGRTRSAPSTELATHWVVAGMVNKAFEANRLKRPEVVEARALTNPSPRGPHLWRVQLRLHDGVTLSDVRSSAEKVRQSLGVPWLRVAQAPDGVTLYAGASPSTADLVNPTTDRATLVSLDWERAFDDAKLVSAAGEVPKLLEVGHLPKNQNVQVLDFALPSGLSVDRIKGALKKLMASTGNEFVEHRSSPRGASAFRLLVAREHPLPDRVDFDFDVACSDRRFIYFGTGIEGEPVGWDVGDSPHALLAGTTGSGKSVLAQNFLWGWVAHGDQVVVVDPMKQAADFQFLAPYASGFAVDVTEAAALLKAVYAEVRRRMALNASHKVGSYLELPDDVRPRRLLVFIDEFTSLMGKDAVPAPSTDPEVMEERARIEELNEARSQIGMFVGKLAREARSAGVHLALGTQALKSDTLQKLPGGSDLKDLALDTLLPVPVSDRFPTGWARNDELVVGDLLYAPDGTTTPILGFSETLSGHDVYEVVLDDGQVVKAGAGHLWQVSRTDAVEGWRDVPMVLTTAQLVHLVADGQEWSVPAAEAVPGHPEARGVPARAVREVRQVESVPTRCIGVAHPGHLFLVEGFVPTHNTNLARTLLGNSTQGDRMSALRSPMEAPPLGESIPKGRGLWEPLSVPVAAAVQTWFAPQSTLGSELASRVDPLPETDRIDYSRFLPRTEDDDHTYGPPPGFGEDTEADPVEVDVEAEVLDLGDLDLELDLDDLELDLDGEPDFDLDHLDGAGPGPAEHPEPDFDLDHLEAPDDHDDDDRAAEGGAGAPEEGGGPAEPAEEDSFEDPGAPGAGGPAEAEDPDGPGLVGPPPAPPAALPVGGGADAAVPDPAGRDAGAGPAGGGGGEPGGAHGRGDEPGVGAAAADEVRVPRVSPWDDDDEFDGPPVAVAPDRRRLSTDDLFD